MANSGGPQSETKNIMCVDYANSPKLQTLFSQKEVGEECELTVELTVISKTPDGCTLAIKKIITEDYEGTEDEKEIVPDNREPVMLSMKNRKVDSSKGKLPAPQTTARPTENSMGTTSYA